MKSLELSLTPWLHVGQTSLFHDRKEEVFQMLLLEQFSTYRVVGQTEINKIMAARPKKKLEFHQLQKKLDLREFHKSWLQVDFIQGILKTDGKFSQKLLFQSSSSNGFLFSLFLKNW